MKKYVTIVIVVVLAAVTTGLNTLAQTPEPADSTTAKTPHRIHRIAGHVRVDAVLDEDVWQKALKLELNYEVNPGENISPPVKTEAWLAYDNSHLYLAIHAYDPEPSQIRACYSDRDYIYTDDWVGFLFDTFNDERHAFVFLCNPLGIQADLTETAAGDDDSWDAIWDSHGRITGDGFIVEIAMPFSSLRFQRSETDQTWGIDIMRSYPRTVSHTIGLIPRDRGNNCYFCQIDKIIGFSGATPGKNVEFDPTFSSLYSETRDIGWDEAGQQIKIGKLIKRDNSNEPGLTARWGFTPNLTLNATANPDFSQVEADVLQMDVNTQFALYYPEKRPFFVEGADYFTTRMNIVHTRALANPDWGIKLTGKAGKNAIGFYSVQDGQTNLLFPGSENSYDGSLIRNNIGTVFRYRRDVGRSSTLGALITDRESEGYYSRLAGADADFRFTRTDQVKVHLFGSQTDYPGAIDTAFGQPNGRLDGTAFDFYYKHAARDYVGFVTYREITSPFRADLGFIPQVGFRYVYSGIAWRWYNNPGYWYTLLSPGVGYEYEEDRSGRILYKGPKLWFDYMGPMQFTFSMQVNLHERWYQGIRFDNTSVTAIAGIQPTAALYLSLIGEYGDGIDYTLARPGERLKLNPYIEFKPGRHINISFDHIYERLTIDEGRLYTANISQSWLVYQFNRRLFMRVVLQYVHNQYDAALYIPEGYSESIIKVPVQGDLFSQILISYKINPQTVLFIGYSDYWSDNYYGFQDIVELTQLDRTVFVKLGYAWVL